MSSTWASLGKIILWRNRSSLCYVLGMTVLLSGLIHWHWGSARELTAISLVCTFYFLFGILCNTQVDPGRGFSGISPYFFKLPIETKSIVVAHLLVGVSVVILVSTLWFALVLRLVDWSVSYLDLTIYLTSCFSVFSSLVWGLARVPRCRLLALSIGFFIMLGLSLGPLGFSSSPASFWQEHRIPLLLGLCLVSVLSPLIVLPLISADRSGGAVRQMWVSEIVFGLMPLRMICHLSGKTPERALFLKELGQSGWFLPGTALLLIGLVNGVACWRFYWWGNVQDGVTATLSNGLVFGVIIIGAYFQGFLLSQFGRSVWSDDRGMATFQGVLPVASHTMVIAKMKAAMVALATSWIVALFGVSLWYWVWEVPLPWIALEGSQYQGLDLGEPKPFVVLGSLAFILSWRSMTCLMWLGLLGRRGALETGLVLVLVQVWAFVSIATWKSFPSFAGFEWLVVISIWIWILGKLALTIIALRGLGRSCFEMKTFLLGYGICWLVATLFAVTSAEWLSDFLGCPLYIVFPFMVTLMPMGSVLAAFTAGSANRHRN